MNNNNLADAVKEAAQNDPDVKEFLKLAANAETADGAVLVGADGEPLIRVRLKSDSNEHTYQQVISLGELVFGVDLLSKEELKEYKNSTRRLQAEAQKMETLSGLEALNFSDQLADMQLESYKPVLAKLKGWSRPQPFNQAEIIEDLVLPDLVDIADEIVRRSNIGRGRADFLGR